MRFARVVILVGGLLAGAGCFSDASSSNPATAGSSSGGGSSSSSSSAEESSSGGEADTTSGADCEGTPGGDVVVDECGVCGGPGGPCVGCTNPAASNYVPLATLDDDSCTCTAAGGGEPDQGVEDWDVGGGAADQWQSFTAGASGGLVRVDLVVSSPLGMMAGPGMIRIYEGEGTGGAELGAQDVMYEPNLGEFQQFTIDPPVVVAEDAVYTIRFSAPEIMT